MLKNKVVGPFEEKKPKGYVNNLGKLAPVTWERETERYVFKVKVMVKHTEDETWFIHKRNFEDKMDKEEILNIFNTLN